MGCHACGHTRIYILVFASNFVGTDLGRRFICAGRLSRQIAAVSQIFICPRPCGRVIPRRERLKGKNHPRILHLCHDEKILEFMLRVQMTKMQRPGATLQATGGPCSGVPWCRSASGRGAQAAPVVQLRTLAHKARWCTAADEQTHVSTNSFASSCPKFEMAKMQRPGATLRARGGPCGGTLLCRSASGHGAQVAPVIRLLTVA